MRILAGRPDIKTVLDFGAGSRTLERFLKTERPDLEITCYDPAIPGMNKLPERKFDLVVSSDVLEHVEPELINNVIDMLVNPTGKTMFHHIACSPCGLMLPDGRNAHVLCEPPEWWKRKFESRSDLFITEYRAIEKLQRRLQRLAVQLTLDKV